MSRCLEPLELQSLIAGELPADQYQQAAEHVETCGRCQAELDTLTPEDDAVARMLEIERRLAPLAPSGLAQRLLKTLSPRAMQTGDAEPASFPAIPGYEIVAFLGAGGMGSVYKGRHLRLQRDDALKVLKTHIATHPEFAARFDRETAALGRLNHPNLVRAFHAGEHQGVRYLAMEYLDGFDLARIARHAGALEIPDACEVIRQAALGLHYAHSNGLVHRDIKPSNIMLAVTEHESPAVKVLDMGLALVADHHLPDQGLTNAGQVMGTLEYMAPEQAGDVHAVDRRADIFSLGCTLYKLLSGSAPVPSQRFDSPLKMIAAIATQTPPPVDRERTLPDGLAAIVHSMIARHPEDRPADASKVAASLTPFTQGANMTALLERTTQAEQAGDIQPDATTLAIANEATPAPHFSAAEHSGVKPALSARGSKWLFATVAVMLLAVVAAAAPVVYFMQTGHGVMRIEVHDPDLHVAFENNKATVTGKGARTISMTAGRHGMLIRRGNLKFETVKFEITKKRKTRLSVSWIDGKVRVVDGARILYPAPSGGAALASNPKKPPAKPVAAPGARPGEAHRPLPHPHIFRIGDKARQPTWKRGQPSNALQRGLITHPAEFPGIKRWQVYFTGDEFYAARFVHYQASPDGRYTAHIIDRGRYDRRLRWPYPELRVYNNQTKKLVYLSPVKATAFSPVWSQDSQSLAIDGEKFQRNLDGSRGAPITGSVRGEAWKAFTPAELEQLPIGASPHRYYPVSQWDASGRFFAVVLQHNVQIFNADGVRVKILEPHQAGMAPGNHISWSASGKYLVTVGSDGLVMWNVETADVIHAIEGAFTSDAQFHPDDDGIIALATQPVSICHWQQRGEWLETANMAKRVKDSPERYIRWSPGGRHIAVNYPNSKVEMYNARGELLFSKNTPITREVFFWTPDGRRLRVGHHNQYRYLTLDGKLIEAAVRKEFPSFAYYLDVHPGGELFSMYGKLYKTADAAPGPRVEPTWDTHYPYAGYAEPAFSGDGRYLATTCRLGTVMRNTSNYKIERIIHALPDNQYVTFSPAGEVLAASPRAGQRFVYLVEDNNGRLQLLSHLQFLQRTRAAQ